MFGLRATRLFRAGLATALVFTLRPAAARAEDLPGARALLSDVARIVAAEEAEAWFTDREALRSIEVHVLASVCRTTPDARAAALAGLRRKHAELGTGEQGFRTQGELTDAVEAALSIERQLRALQAAVAREDECPFWVHVEPGFKGLQSDRERFTLSVESGGNVQLRYTEKRWTFGGGGLGRVLGGWGFDGQHTLLLGGEFGGGAMLKPNTNASQFVINYFPALPIVFRTRHLTWQYDLELAPVALFQADNTRLSYGGRVAGSFAFTALRRRNVLPWAGLSVAYEHYFEGNGREPTHFIRGGLRIGLPWDP
jgi:hypothetical protein